MRIPGQGTVLALLAGWVLLGGDAGAQQVSLADSARTVRAERATRMKATRHFDNDNLPTTAPISEVGPTAPENPTVLSTETASAQAGSEAKTRSGADAGPVQASEDLVRKIKEQKAQAELQNREMDVLQREYQLRQAAFYADAGYRLRNQGGWDREDEKYRQQLAEKHLAIESAEKQLEDLEEQARKANVAPGFRE